MHSSTVDMMAARRAALDAMAGLPEPGKGDRPFATIRIDVRRYLDRDRPDHVPAGLVAVVVDRLVRDGTMWGDGAALLTGLADFFDVPAARRFHEALFLAVWQRFELWAGPEIPGSGYRVKTNVTADGAIPLELYGSRWSFKQLHMDRDALLFSHSYGPVAGFSGGGLLLADMRTYLHRHAFRFEDLFDWSDEPTAGSKPVLRAEHEANVMAECGVDLGPLGPGEIVFVNNLPSAGILHGVTPVLVDDQATYVREYHRCSVRRLTGAEDGTAETGESR